MVGKRTAVVCYTPADSFTVLETKLNNDIRDAEVRWP